MAPRKRKQSCSRPQPMPLKVYVSCAPSPVRVLKVHPRKSAQGGGLFFFESRVISAHSRNYRPAYNEMHANVNVTTPPSECAYAGSVVRR